MRKVVLVTGGAKGIGKATVEKFASEGFDVVINYHKSEARANELKNAVESKFGVKALAICADVSNEVEVKNMFEQIDKVFGRLDVVVNNAGVVFDRNFEDITVEEFKRVLDVNVIGAFIVSRFASRLMKNGGGTSSIVNVSSTSGTKVVSPDCLDYNISKIGLQSLTRDLAFRFKPSIRVNSVSIGWADTDMNKDLPKEYIQEEIDKIYVKRFAKPEEIANVIFFLSSDDAGYINGANVIVDGGY